MACELLGDDRAVGRAHGVQEGQDDRGPRRSASDTGPPGRRPAGTRGRDRRSRSATPSVASAICGSAVPLAAATPWGRRRQQDPERRRRRRPAARRGGCRSPPTTARLGTAAGRPPSVSGPGAGPSPHVRTHARLPRPPAAAHVGPLGGRRPVSAAADRFAARHVRRRPGAPRRRTAYGRPGDGQVAPDGHEEERQHRIGVGPTPPQNPKSSMSTQSATHEHGQDDHGGQEHPPPGPDAHQRVRCPSPARATTANRLTPQPCARSNDANEDTTATGAAAGCDVCAIWPTMAASVPGYCPTVPCQNPRPGQAWSTAHPEQQDARGRAARPGRAAGRPRPGRAAPPGPPATT